MSEEPKSVRRRALLNPLELCLSAIRELLRAPLERYGAVMFNRGVRYERERLEQLHSTLPPAPNPAVSVEPGEWDPDKTPPQPMRILNADQLQALDLNAVDVAEEVVVLPQQPDPRTK